MKVVLKLLAVYPVMLAAMLMFVNPVTKPAHGSTLIVVVMKIVKKLVLLRLAAYLVYVYQTKAVVMRKIIPSFVVMIWGALGKSVNAAKRAAVVSK